MAERLCEHAVLRRVAGHEPLVLLGLVTPGDGPSWRAARTAAADALGVANRVVSPMAVDTLLRWCVGQLLWPASAEEAAFAAGLLADGLPSVAPASAGNGWTADGGAQRAVSSGVRVDGADDAGD